MKNPLKETIKNFFNGIVKSTNSADLSDAPYECYAENESEQVVEYNKRTVKLLRDRLEKLTIKYNDLEQKHNHILKLYFEMENNIKNLKEKYDYADGCAKRFYDENVALREHYSRILNEKISIQERLTNLYAEICEKENSAENVSETSTFDRG